MEFNINDTIKDLLTKSLQQKETVHIHLRSNKSYSGKVEKIGQHVVSLKQIGDRSFFHAFIRIEDISSVEFRNEE